MLDKSPKGKRRILTATLLLTLLISALTATLLINDATASSPPVPEPRRIYVSVKSPISKVYDTTEIPLQFHAAVQLPYLMTSYSVNYELLSVRYWLDAQLVGQQNGEDLPKTYSVALTGLSDGEHSVKVWMKVYAFSEYFSGYSDTVSFTVKTQPPSIRVLTSQETFEASDVPLNFTVNEPASWVGYSLDGNNAVTVTNDVESTEWFGRDNYRLVLNGLPAGAHSLTVYAEDTVGNRGASETFSFTVTPQTPSETEQTQPETEQTEHSPTALAAVGISTAVVAVSIGLLVYFKKRKR